MKIRLMWKSGQTEDITLAELTLRLPKVLSDPKKSQEVLRGLKECGKVWCDYFWAEEIK